MEHGIGISPPNFSALGCLDQILWTGVESPPVLQRDKKTSAYRVKPRALLSSEFREIYHLQSYLSPLFGQR